MFFTKLIAAALVALAIAPAAAQTEAAAPMTPKDFTLPAVNGGKDFTLSEAKGRVVALHFLLKTECPICIRTTNEYHLKGAELAGVQQVFIKPDSAEQIMAWVGKAGASVPTIYRDADATLAKEFGIPDGYQFHGEVVHFPALVILDQQGKEVFRYVGKNNSDRVPFDTFTAQVAKLLPPAHVEHYNVKPGKPAVAGYDVVSYQTTGPQMGDPAIVSRYRGVTYQFATTRNRDTFNLSPERYVPSYGGWCATAMADGSKVSIDPKNYTIDDGRLNLFYKGILGNAKPDWQQNIGTLKPKADASWKSTAGE